MSVHAPHFIPAKSTIRKIQLVVLVIATGVALVTSFLGPGWFNSLISRGEDISQNDYGPIVAVLLAAFFFEMLAERMTTFVQIDQIETGLWDIKDQVTTFFARFAQGNEYHVFHELAWKYMLRGKGTFENAETFTVNRDSSLDLWRDCLVDSKQWEALSYAPDLWQNDERRKSQIFQEAHIELRGSIRRVFVFDSPEDLQTFSNVLSQQMPSADVRWIIKDHLLNLVRERLGNLPGVDELLDFAIVDLTSYVLWFRLKDGSKQLERATISVSHPLRERARTIFDIAYENGRVFENTESSESSLTSIRQNGYQSAK